jgi:hypothetical protein
MQAEKKQQKLKEKDQETIKQVEEAELWKKTLKKADGEVVKDDVKLLKKAVKRKEIQKKKSSKLWAEKEETKQKEMERRQKKRQDNIQARKDAKIANKVSKKKKRPGFEGRSSKPKK